MEKKYCTAVVLAAGKGSRMGGNTAKQYMEIGGKPLVAYALEVFEASPVIDEIILMTDAGHMEYVQTEIVEAYGLKKVSTIGAGGGERYESVWKALCTLMDLSLIHIWNRTETHGCHGDFCQGQRGPGHCPGGPGEQPGSQKPV